MYIYIYIYIHIYYTYTYVQVSPKGDLGVDVPVAVEVGRQVFVRQASYQYTSATDVVIMVLTQSVPQLLGPPPGLTCIIHV